MPLKIHGSTRLCLTQKNLGIKKTEIVLHCPFFIPFLLAVETKRVVIQILRKLKKLYQKMRKYSTLYHDD